MYRSYGFAPEYWPWPCSADDAVPPGRFAEYRAAICEGFCPACRIPFTSLRNVQPGGHCKGKYPVWTCKGPDGGYGVTWEYNVKNDVIEWHSDGLEGYSSIHMMVMNVDEYRR